MPPVDSIRVQGLREFNRELKQIDAKFPKAVRLVNKAIADDVASDARSKAQSQGGVAAKTAPSIRALAQQSRAQVAIGGTRYPFAFGAEFGAAHNVERNTRRGSVLGWNQFQAWRGNDAGAGYFLFPTIREMRRSEVMDRYQRLLTEVVRDAFPN